MFDRDIPFAVRIMPVCSRLAIRVFDAGRLRAAFTRGRQKSGAIVLMVRLFRDGLLISEPILRYVRSLFHSRLIFG